MRHWMTSWSGFISTDHVSSLSCTLVFREINYITTGPHHLSLLMGQWLLHILCICYYIIQYFPEIRSLTLWLATAFGWTTWGDISQWQLGAGNLTLMVCLIFPPPLFVLQPTTPWRCGNVWIELLSLTYPRQQQVLWQLSRSRIGMHWTNHIPVMSQHTWNL